MLGSLVAAIRRNHALEHGTVTVLLGRRGTPPRLAGRAVPDGFYIYGRLPADELLSCAREALARMQAGEARLAVTPLCGTNIAVAGVLGALGTFAALGRRPSLGRLPNAFTLASLGVTLSQPLGRWVQQAVTTRPDLDRVSITGIRRGAGGWIHKIETSGAMKA